MTGCCGGLAGGVALTGVCFLFLSSSSSDESESDDESFFLLLARLAGGGIAVFGVVALTVAKQRWDNLVMFHNKCTLYVLTACHHQNHYYCLTKLLSLLLVELVWRLMLV